MVDDIVTRLRSATTQREWWPRDRLDAADEIERLRERRDDWCAAMTENHDLWRENERLRAAAEMALETLIGCCVSAGGVDDRKTILEAQDMLRAALEGEKKNDAST
jgi:hypothetical protein